MAHESWRGEELQGLKRQDEAWTNRATMSGFAGLFPARSVWASSSRCAGWSICRGSTRCRPTARRGSQPRPWPDSFPHPRLHRAQGQGCGLDLPRANPGKRIVSTQHLPPPPSPSQPHCLCLPHGSTTAANRRSARSRLTSSNAWSRRVLLGRRPLFGPRGCPRGSLIKTSRRAVSDRLPGGCDRPGARGLNPGNGRLADDKPVVRHRDG
jgi:hypothetical protein